MSVRRQLRILPVAALLLLAIIGVDVAQAQNLDAALREEVVSVPLPPGSGVAALVATSYRPQGDGPFPLIVLSHGSPANAAERGKMGRYRVLSRIREFTRRGFAVIVPMRRGYGDTGGVWAETFFRCSAPDYYAAGVQAAVDLVATVDYARTLAYVDRERIILVGQSAGGFASIAAASQGPPGVIAVVNLSGGRGGRPDTHPGEPCVPDNMSRAIARFAPTISVPVLWHYAENDRFFAPEHVRAWFHAFEVAGARGVLVMQPPFGNDGHSMFAAAAGLPIWTAAFDGFLRPLGFDYPVPGK
jgi:dienelactone hydrolase